MKKFEFGPYDFEDLKEKALAPTATQDDIDALGEWLNKYDVPSYNGESFYLYDENDHRQGSIYPEWNDPDENDQSEIIRWHLGY